MTTPGYGFVFITGDSDPSPPIFSDMSVLGLCLPSDDANAAIFPLNTPVDCNTGDQAMLQAMGTGDLYQYVNLINNQLADLEGSSRAVVVRVAKGANIDETIANIVGDAGAGTGVHAFLRSAQLLGVIPRLLGAPGYTGKFTRTGATIGVTSAAKVGNVGNGVLTRATPAYDANAQNGIYVVKCIGGSRNAVSAPKSGILGNGVLGSLTADVTAPVGVWKVVCQAAATNGGAFAVFRPDNSLDGVALVGQAYNSAAGPNFTITDGTTDFSVGDEFDITVTATVPANGGVFSVKDPFGISLPNATVGVAYTTQVLFTIADGSTDFAIGDEFDITVVVTAGTALANPVCAALPAICSALLAHAVVGAFNPAGQNRQDETDWAQTMNDRRLIRVGNSVVVGNGLVNTTLDHAGVVLGLGVRTDFKWGGVPSHSFGNIAVQGILGLGRYDSFSILDGATDGQELLAVGVGVLERGEIAAEWAAGPSGFISISYQNADPDPIWMFYNKSRTRDYTHLALLRSIRKRLAADNVTRHGIQAVLNDMVVVLIELQHQEATIGFTVGFNPSVNSPENLRLGKFRVNFQSEEPAPITQITIDSLPNRAALEVELLAIAQQTSTVLANAA